MLRATDVEAMNMPARSARDPRLTPPTIREAEGTTILLPPLHDHRCRTYILRRTLKLGPAPATYD